MLESAEAKLEAILTVINTLSIWTTTIERVIGDLQQHQFPANLGRGALLVILLLDNALTVKQLSIEFV